MDTSVAISEGENNHKIDLTPARVNYSKSEIQLFKMIPQDGTKISSKTLVKLKKRKYKWDIANPLNALWVTMDSLMKKIVKNKETFRIRRSEKKGPYPQFFWIERT
jgi:hypothetical protein